MYTPEMLSSMKKVEAAREANIAYEPKRLTAEEKEALLKDKAYINVDKFWTDHIDAMNTLRNEIGVLAYGQKNPIVAYKNQGFEMFDKMIGDVREYTASSLFRTKIKVNIVPQMPKGPVAMGNVNKEENKTVKKSSAHIGRNDLCPCGSGKKYKNCCGKSE